MVNDDVTPPPKFRLIVDNSAPGAWQLDLTRSDRGVLHPTVANAMILLANDATLAGLLAYDEFAHRIVIRAAPPVCHTGASVPPGPYPRAITGTDVTLIQGYMQRALGLRIGQQVAEQAVATVAEQTRIHPVRDWVDGLKWDGKARVAHWLRLCFGCPDDAYHAAAGSKFLIAGVRRVRSPGCKFDHALMLDSAQGLGKSTTCEALFGAPWFTDNLPHDLCSKDAQLGLSGKWGIELSELNFFDRSSTPSAKAFFSRRIDYYRPPYGRGYVERPRQSLFIGTTNDPEYLTDLTGNRRYWPVHCRKAEPLWVAEVRDQLWAEAALLEAEGDSLWLDDREVAQAASSHQSDRMVTDVWTDAIIVHLTQDAFEPRIRVSDILTAIGVPRPQQSRAAEMRCAGVLRSMGYSRKRGNVSGMNVSFWEKEVE